MKLTTKSEYSLLLLINLARKERQHSGPVKLEELCASNQIPVKYAEHLFAALKKNHIVKSRRGVSGGYELARPASQISMAEIIRYMDGALAPTESVSKYYYSDTPVSKETRLISIFSRIRNYIADTLENISLEELI